MQYIYFLYHNKHVQINGVQWEFEQSASGRNAISRPRHPTEEDFLKYTHKCACKYVKIPIFTKMKPGGELRIRIHILNIMVIYLCNSYLTHDFVNNYIFFSFFYPGRPEWRASTTSLRYDIVLYEEPPDYTVG